MSRRTIAKFCTFVICVSIVHTAAVGCSYFSQERRSAANAIPANPDYSTPKVIGKIKNSRITESSGIAASPCQTDVYWTHNDAGSAAFIYAFNSKGDDLGTWTVPGVTSKDWEDIASYKDASGQCYLYIGEIGNNDEGREAHAVFRVREPAIAGAAKSPRATAAAEAARFIYPDEGQNAEAMMVHPQTGDIYIATKRVKGPSRIYKIKANFGSEPVTAEKVGEISVPSVPNGLLTGGAISPDATRVILCDYTAGYELKLPQPNASFDEIWKQRPVPVNLGDRKQGEAVTYAPDGRSILATSEKKNPPIIEIRRNE